MAKHSTSFVCQACGAVYTRWQGKCDSCGEWNTIAEEAAAAAAADPPATAADADAGTVSDPPAAAL